MGMREAEGEPERDTPLAVKETEEHALSDVVGEKVPLTLLEGDSEEPPVEEYVADGEPLSDAAPVDDRVPFSERVAESAAEAERMALSDRNCAGDVVIVLRIVGEAGGERAVEREALREAVPLGERRADNDATRKAEKEGEGVADADTVAFHLTGEGLPKLVSVEFHTET